jgi:photosystem II stability/assembly factor-like uncharacterized protein
MKMLVSIAVLVGLGYAQLGGLGNGVIGDGNLRGVSAVGEKLVWASGSKGTIIRTPDGGATWWRLGTPEDSHDFDFRDIEAFSADVAYVMSSGPGEQSRIWKTVDGAKTWRQQYTNKAPSFFLDSLACWDVKHCVALSDPVDGKFLVLMTEDGEQWRELPRDKMPPAMVTGDVKEGAFAASGTAITVGGNDIWFATGGPAARVFHSHDRGKSWTVAETPMVHGEASQGIFSIAFRDAKHGIVVGGDYKQPDKTGANAAFTDDGGKSWKLAKAPTLPYCSAAVMTKVPERVIAVGLGGVFEIVGEGSRAEVQKVFTPPYNAVSGNWLVGPNGVRFHWYHAKPPSLKDAKPNSR